MNITLDTWIISDTHFRHKNIVRLCNRPENHDRIIKNNWQELVGYKDPLLHLGDLTVWYNDELMLEAESIAAYLPGTKMMIRGNHDPRTDEYYRNLGYQIVPEFIQEFDKQRVLFSHYPDVKRIGFWDINIHGHIHNNDLDSELIESKRRYVNVSIEVMNYKPVRLGEILENWPNYNTNN